jgi:hypothetical protein
MPGDDGLLLPKAWTMPTMSARQMQDVERLNRFQRVSCPYQR